MWLPTTRVDGLTLSKLCLGGGKMEALPIDTGKTLVRRAMELGINVFDAHHRYGNCETILGHFPQVIKMAKISAYKPNIELLLERSTVRMRDGIEIYWVSDLDDSSLYEKGCRHYEHLRDHDIMIACNGMKLKGRVGRLGITTESPEMGYRFLREYPECMFFMIPLHFESSGRMLEFAKEIKRQGKYLFIIKPFNDGLSFTEGRINEDIKTSFGAIDMVKPDVICFGTKNTEHLEATVEIFNSLMGVGNAG